METKHRYIIVSNSGRAHRKNYKILDLHKIELLPETYEHKPISECFALNKEKSGVTVIEHALDNTYTEQAKSNASERSKTATVNFIMACTVCGKELKIEMVLLEEDNSIFFNVDPCDVCCCETKKHTFASKYIFDV